MNPLLSFYRLLCAFVSLFARTPPAAAVGGPPRGGARREHRRRMPAPTLRAMLAHAPFPPHVLARYAHRTPRLHMRRRANA